MSMKTNHIRLVGSMNDNHFTFTYFRKCDTPLRTYLDGFDSEDYWILKGSGHQRLVTYNEFTEFKYSAYTLFNKSIYNIDNILEWCSFMKPIQYLSKPTPPFSPKKIIIKKN